MASTTLPKTPVDLHGSLGDHTCSTHFLAQKCLIGAWASLLNLSRKGHAEAARQLGLDIFGERAFTTALSHALLVCEATSGAAEGFARIEVKGVMGLHICDDWEMGKRSLVGAWASLLNLKMMEEAEMIKELAVKVYGEQAWEKSVKEAIPQTSSIDKKETLGKKNIAPFDAVNQAANLARFQPQLALGRTRAQSWAFTAIPEDEMAKIRGKANITKAAAPSNDYGSYCERCGTRNAAGVPTMEADAEKKEWVVEGKVEGKIKAKTLAAGEKSMIEDAGKVEYIEMNSGATRKDSKDESTPEGMFQGADKISGKDLKDNGGSAEERAKDKATAASKVCDRCSAEDGAVVGDKKSFWPFHVLDSGKVERVRRDSK